MNLKEFTEYCLGNCQYTDNPTYKPKQRYSRDKEIVPEEVPSIYTQWKTGGKTGGNCWGDEAEEYVQEEQEPFFKDLDNLLTKIVPKLSFIQYKDIESFIRYHQYTEHEYYGNYDNFKRKFIVIETLYNYLKEVDQL